MQCLIHQIEWDFLIQSHNSMFTSGIQRRNQLLKEVCKNFQPPGNFRMNACLQTVFFFTLIPFNVTLHASNLSFCIFSHTDKHTYSLRYKHNLSVIISFFHHKNLVHCVIHVSIDLSSQQRVFSIFQKNEYHKWFTIEFCIHMVTREKASL